MLQRCFLDEEIELRKLRSFLLGKQQQEKFHFANPGRYRREVIVPILYFPTSIETLVLHHFGIFIRFLHEENDELLELAVPSQSEKHHELVRRVAAPALLYLRLRTWLLRNFFLHGR